MLTRVDVNAGDNTDTRQQWSIGGNCPGKIGGRRDWKGNDRQREAMRQAAGNERQAAEANLEAKSAGRKEWEWEFLFFYRCRTSLIERQL